MTTTSSTDLQGLLAAKKAALTQPPAADVIDVDVVTGEIVPPADTAPPSENGGVPQSAAVQPAAPAPVETVTVFPVVPPKVLGGIPYARDYVKLSKTICMTEMVPQALRGRYDAITATFLRGYEMGFAPMQSLDSFNVIQGSVGLKPEAMRALIFDNGHEIILEEEYGQDGQILAITAECKRKGWDKARSYRYSMDDARQAGLTGKDNWKKMPRAMLEARATAGAGRRYFADILAGMSYTPEEIRDFNGPAEQEATPSQSAPVGTLVPPATGEGSSLSSPETSPPHASAPVASSADEPPCLNDAESTDGASATSPEASDDSAPLTASTPPKKPRGRPRKAQQPPLVAPSAPAPAATTAQDAPPEQTSLNTGGELPLVATPDPEVPLGPGEAGVLVQMRGALTELLRTVPTVQQPLVRAFLQRHFPQGSAELDAEQLQKCIDITAGWPDSADQHPLPDETVDGDGNPF